MPTTPRRPRFSPGLSQTELVAGYKKIGQKPPIKKADVVKALKPYGIKLNRGRRRHSDRQLMGLAARAVIKKWKTDQAKKAKK